MAYGKTRKKQKIGRSRFDLAYSKRLAFWISYPVPRTPYAGGFTLVEVVIAMVILSVGLLATLAMFPVGIKAGRRSTASTEVAIVAGRLLEQVQVAGYDGMTADPPRVELSGQEGRYRYDIATTEPTLEGVDSAAAVRRVDLTFSWEEQGATQQETFVTYVAR